MDKGAYFVDEDLPRICYKNHTKAEKKMKIELSWEMTVITLKDKDEGLMLHFLALVFQIESPRSHLFYSDL